MMIVLALVVEPLEQRQDLLGRHRIEVARRFVGQDEVRIVHQAAGDGHALLLAAGKLRRPVQQPVAQADQVGQLAAATCAPRR